MIFIHFFYSLPISYQMNMVDKNYFLLKIHWLSVVEPKVNNFYLKTIEIQHNFNEKTSFKNVSLIIHHNFFIYNH